MQSVVIRVMNMYVAKAGRAGVTATVPATAESLTRSTTLTVNTKLPNETTAKTTCERRSTPMCRIHTPSKSGE